MLARLADRLSGLVETVRASAPDPETQLEELLIRMYRNTLEHPNDTQLLLRELLDNRARAKQAHAWYMKDFLAALAAMVRKTPGGRRADEAQGLARIYFVIGAINFFAASQPTLLQMYGKSRLEVLKEQFPLEIRRMVRGG